MSKKRKMTKNEKRIRRYIFARKLTTRSWMILIFTVPIIGLILLLIGGLDLIEDIFFPYIPIAICVILIPLIIIERIMGRFCPFCHKKFHVVEAFFISFPKKCNLCGEDLTKESQYYK